MECPGLKIKYSIPHFEIHGLPHVSPSGFLLALKRLPRNIAARGPDPISGGGEVGVINHAGGREKIIPKMYSGK
jgi:hypothetical protein